MGFGVSMRYLHVGDGSFLLLYLLHKGINAVRSLIAKDASQRLKMPGKTPQSNRTVTGGNLQFSPLSSPAAGARVALGTRGQEGLARVEGLACPSLYLPLVPSTRLLCSGAAPCTESSSAAHSDPGAWGDQFCCSHIPEQHRECGERGGVRGTAVGQDPVGIRSDDLSNPKFWASNCNKEVFGVTGAAVVMGRRGDDGE